MQDNYEGSITVHAANPWENNPYTTCDFNPLLNGTGPCLFEWLDHNAGPYAQGSSPLYIFFRSSVSKNNDLEISFFGAPDGEFRGHYPGWSRDRPSETSCFWSMVKMQVGNDAGTVKLRSSDPTEPPRIDFRFFEQQGEHDLQALSEGAQFTLEVFESLGEPYAPFEVIEPVPGVDLKQSLMDHAFSHHVTSTCRMGPIDDPDYCVDSEFRVYGVEGLRVVDASILPRTPGGFPVAPFLGITARRIV